MIFPKNSRRSSAVSMMGQRKHRPDYMIIIISLILLALGLIVIYSISPGLSAQKNVSENYYVSKQVIAILLGMVAFIITAKMPINLWRKFEKPLVIISLISIVAVRVFGENVNGAYRWIHIAGLSFQAVELIKFALIIWLGGFLLDRIRQNQLQSTKRTLYPLLLILAFVGGVVAILQSDLGSMGVIVVITGAMSFVAGVPMKRILAIGGLILIGTILLISTSSYRKDRLQTFLQPSRDCQSTGYQACQALIAVGSGGIAGLGIANSVQAYGYLPESANDSIFAIFAEKFGFLGSSLLIGLFVALFIRIKNIAEKAPDDYSRLLVVGVLAWISTQMIINIGAMLGLLPLKGITLPFISYGGTSLLFLLGALGIVFNISRFTSLGRSANVFTKESTNENSSDRRGNRGTHITYPGRSQRT